MKFIAIFFVAVALVFAGDSNPVFAAQAVCYDIAVTTDEKTMSSQQRYAQQYTPQNDIEIVSMSFNVYGNLADVGDFVVWISETSAGLPTGVMVTGSLVNKPSNVVPDKPVGAQQEFICADQPTINHTFNFAGSVFLTGGTMYALVLYHETGSQTSTFGFVRNAPDTAEGSGLSCTGVNCPSHIGWQVNTFGGDNYDIVFSLEDQYIDPAAEPSDGKIDGQIDRFREYLKLDGDVGGLLFSLVVISFVFAIGLYWKIPFIVIALFNTMAVGAAARAGIMPPWILMAVIAVAGLALVFALANRGRSSEG